MTAAMVDERIFTVAEVAERLRVTEAGVREWLRTGKLRGMRLSGNRLGWRIRESDLVRFMESQMNQPDQEP